MTDKDFIDLEMLLNELREELGYRYVIAPQYVQDGYNISIYSEDGDMINQTTQPTLKEAINKLKK